MAPAAIAAPERTSVYESIKQNSEFPPETAVGWLGCWRRWAPAAVQLLHHCKLQLEHQQPL